MSRVPLQWRVLLLEGKGQGRGFIITMALTNRNVDPVLDVHDLQVVVSKSVHIDPVVEPHGLPAPNADAVGLDARTGGLAGLKGDEDRLLDKAIQITQVTQSDKENLAPHPASPPRFMRHSPTG